jgi:hypothetical protein
MLSREHCFTDNNASPIKFIYLVYHTFQFSTMNLSFDTSQYTSQVSPSSIPGLLWAYYVQNLWNYESSSWVARIAYSCRILAILVSLPIIILGLLVGRNSVTIKVYLVDLYLGHCFVRHRSHSWCYRRRKSFNERQSHRSQYHDTSRWHNHSWV